jgi:V/A-type H+-transporting ATPase subunit C
MSAAAHAYLNTRVSVMSTRLLDHDQISALSRLKLPELAERLRLEPLLDETLSVRAKSRAVEQALIHTLMAELQILIRPVNATERDLMLKWGRKFALFNLKTLLRGKLYQRDQAEIHENLYDLPAAVRLPVPRRELFNAENAPELLRVLEQTQYGLIARQAREVYEQRRDPFALEAAIDQRYYSEMTRAVMRFESASLQPLRQLLGAVLDQVNLMWLLRFRFSYKLSPSETFYYLVPSFRLLHRGRLLDLANIDSLEQLIAALPPPLDQVLAGSSSLIEVQKRSGALMAVEVRRSLSQGSAGIARALAYLILRERDLYTLFSLIQGRLLDLPEPLIQIGIELADPHCPSTMPAAA